MTGFPLNFLHCENAVLGNVTFVLLFLIWAGLACLFFNNKKGYIFGKCKSPFTPKVK